MARCFFLHAADLHLGAPLKSLGQKIEADKAEYIRNETKRVFDDLVTVAIERRVEFVVLAGDVYDDAPYDQKAQLRVNDGFRRLQKAGIRVFMVHGNHDPLSAVDLSTIGELPPNVTVFPHDSVERHPILLSNGVTVTVAGISYLNESETRPLASMFDGLSGSPLVGVLHTNVGGSRDHGDYAPCTARELLDSPVNYWALGHIHLRSVNGSLNNWWVYSGNLQGRSTKPSECGPKGVMIVPIDEAGVVHEPEFVACDRARFETVLVPCEEFTNTYEALEGAASRVAEKVEENGSLPSVIQVVLTGATSAHGTITEEEFLEVLTNRCENFIGRGQVVSVIYHTRKKVDLDEIRKSKTIIKEAMEVISSLREDETLPIISMSEVPQSVKKYFTDEDNKPNRERDRPEILERADQILIDQLWGAT